MKARVRAEYAGTGRLPNQNGKEDDEITKVGGWSRRGGLALPSQVDEG